jgi:nitrate/nitrite-specific signal transduction histidine kinase
MPNIIRREFLMRGAILLAASVVPTHPVRAAAIANANESINKAGRLRMLSQRMAKAYCQIGLDVLSDNSRRILDLSVKLYQEHLNELKAFAPSVDIKATYTELDAIWQRYRQLLIGVPSVNNARLIAQINEDALRVAHLGTTQLELASSASAGRLINISGRQRMLSQRLAKFYMFRQWGIGIPGMDTEMQLAKREYASAMDALDRTPENTDKIKSELSLARTQWMFFEHSLQQQSIGDKNPHHAVSVASTSERILEMMDHVTDLYALLPASSGAAPRSARPARG